MEPYLGVTPPHCWLSILPTGCAQRLSQPLTWGVDTTLEDRRLRSCMVDASDPCCPQG